MSAPPTPTLDTTDRGGILEVARRSASRISRANPFIRMLAVSGSLTRPGHNGHHDDVDFFVVAERGRVWEAFLGCLLAGWRSARRLGLPRTFFCFNYLVDEDHPEEIDLSLDEYLRDFLRLEVLVGWDVYLSLLERFRHRLSGPEPELYDQACRRARSEVQRSGGTAQRRGTAVRLQRFGYRLARGPFVLAAKWMERRRARRFPGGPIYSNRRVVRSHFRRSWGDASPSPDGVASSLAFTNLADSYDDDTVASPANRHMREIVRETLVGLVRPGVRVLDLGCGTGVDAVWMAERGASVLAVDVSEGMVDRARRRVEAAGLGDRVEVRRLAVERFSSLLPDYARSFDLVLANFGALNLSGDPDRWAPVLARMLKPRGRLAASVMNRWSAWELLAGLLHGRPSFAFRRLRGDPITVGGVPLVARLYTPGGLARSLASHFERRNVRGLCTVSPPPALEHLAEVLPLVRRVLDRLDRLAGRWPVFRALGDHFLIVLRQRSGTLLDYRTRGGVTASPVVADVNGDGTPEILVAADRLHLFDRRGRDIGGWPRRPGGPMASTPRIDTRAGGTTLYVGSDDDYLHAVRFDGGPVAGFPYPTGGDVFSSPWVGDLAEDGEQKTVFGSDDGNIYALDSKGMPVPGWPVKTGGFVSASPAVAQTDTGRAVIVGSWDGLLHGLDARGRALPNWPRPLGSPVWSTAAIGDLDGDGEAEIVVAAQGLFAFRGDGTALPGFPVRLGGYAVASPAVADIDGDGRPEVVVGSDRLYAFRSDGSCVPGFPLDLGAYLWASPVLVDVDGDGRPDIVVGDFRGRVWAVNGDGGTIPGYPHTIGERITAAATAADIDGDRYLELLVASSDGRVVALPTEAFDGPEAAPWPAFGGPGDPDAAPAIRLALRGFEGGMDHVERPSVTVPGAVFRRQFATEPVIPAKAGIQSARLWIPASAGKTGVGGRADGTAASVEPRVRHSTGSPNGGAALRLVPGIPRPFQVTEVHLDIADESGLVGGQVHYRLNGRVHPTPLLKGGGRYFALVQPLPPLKPVTLTCELEWEDGSRTRLPERGSLGFRVGVPGLRHRSGPRG